MKLSILIPAYNPGSRLRGVLDALETQMAGRTDVEICVLDDGSDEDLSWVKGYPHVRYKRQSNTGVSEARNVLLQMATGEYIQWIDADDTVYDNCLAVVFDNINTGYDWVSYDWVCDGRSAKAYQNKDTLMVNCAVWAYTFRRALVHGVLFDRAMKTGSDQVWLRSVLTDDCMHTHDHRIFYNYRWAHNRHSLSHRQQRGEFS